MAPSLPAADTLTLAPNGPVAANDGAHSVRVVLVAVGVAAAVLLLPACALLARMLARSRRHVRPRPRRVRVAVHAAADIPSTAGTERTACGPREGSGGRAGISSRGSADLDTGKAAAARQQVRMLTPSDASVFTAALGSRDRDGAA